MKITCMNIVKVKINLCASFADSSRWSMKVGTGALQPPHLHLARAHQIGQCHS